MAMSSKESGSTENTVKSAIPTNSKITPKTWLVYPIINSSFFSTAACNFVVLPYFYLIHSYTCISVFSDRVLPTVVIFFR